MLKIQKTRKVFFPPELWCEVISFMQDTSDVQNVIYHSRCFLNYVEYERSDVCKHLTFKLNNPMVLRSKRAFVSNLEVNVKEKGFKYSKLNYFPSLANLSGDYEQMSIIKSVNDLKFLKNVTLGAEYKAKTSHFKKFGDLKSLTIENCKVSQRHLQYLKNIEELRVIGDRTNLIAKSLEKMPKLRLLMISKNKKVTCGIFRMLKNLNTLYVRGCENMFKKEDSEFFKKGLPNLKILRVDCNRNFADDAEALLKSKESLCGLYFTRLDMRKLKGLEGLANLGYARFEMCALSNHLLKSVKWDCPKLKIEKNNCSVR